MYVPGNSDEVSLSENFYNVFVNIGLRLSGGKITYDFFTTKQSSMCIARSVRTDVCSLKLSKLLAADNQCEMHWNKAYSATRKFCDPV